MSDDGSRIERCYFEADEPVCFDDGVTYTDGPVIATDPRCYEWNHSIGEIVGALLGHGMRIDRLDEHPWADFAQHPNLQPDDEGRWHAPHDVPSIPRSFTITATNIGHA